MFSDQSVHGYAVVIGRGISMVTHWLNECDKHQGVSAVSVNNGYADFEAGWGLATDIHWAARGGLVSEGGSKQSLQVLPCDQGHRMQTTATYFSSI